LVIAGTCDEKVDILLDWIVLLIGLERSTAAARFAARLSVLFQRAILRVLEPSSCAGGLTGEYSVSRMCPDLSFICPCEEMKRGEAARRNFFNVKIVNADTCEENVAVKIVIAGTSKEKVDARRCAALEAEDPYARLLASR
jgi:hypothetical protein